VTGPFLANRADILADPLGKGPPSEISFFQTRGEALLERCFFQTRGEALHEPQSLIYLHLTCRVHEADDGGPFRVDARHIGRSRGTRNHGNTISPSLGRRRGRGIPVRRTNGPPLLAAWGRTFRNPRRPNISRSASGHGK